MTLSDRLQGLFELESNFWTSDQRQWAALSFARVNSLNPWSTGSQLAAHENGVPGVPPPSPDRTPWVPKPRPPGKTLSSSSSFASDTNSGPGLSLRLRLGLPSGSGQPSASGAVRDSTSGPNPGPMSAAAEIESWAGEGALAPRPLEAVAPVQPREGGGVWWESGCGPMKQYSVRQRRMREGHVVQEFAITDCERKKPPLLVRAIHSFILHTRHPSPHLHSHLTVPLCNLQRLLDFSKSYVLPEGFPHSVAPCYTPYMQWRFVQVRVRVRVRVHHFAVFLILDRRVMRVQSTVISRACACSIFLAEPLACSPRDPCCTPWASPTPAPPRGRWRLTGSSK